jgi:DNA-directed RNA polymerase subunit M/transcription elongation factor TFIIS
MCHRCGGLIVPAEEVINYPANFTQWKCANCGDRYDKAMLRMRLLQSARRMAANAKLLNEADGIAARGYAKHATE